MPRQIRPLMGYEQEVLDLFADGRKHKHAEIGDIMVAYGRARQQASMLLNKLIKHGDIRKYDTGWYGIKNIDPDNDVCPHCGRSGPKPPPKVAGALPVRHYPIDPISPTPQYLGQLPMTDIDMPREEPAEGKEPPEDDYVEEDEDDEGFDGFDIVEGEVEITPYVDED